MGYKQIYKPLQMAICGALIGMAFTACSNSEVDDVTLSTEERVPLSVSAIIQSGDGTRKAGLDAEIFEVGDTIGLFILDDESNAYNESSDSYNVPAVFNGTDFDLSQEVYLSDETASVYAYYPYTGELSDNPVEFAVYSCDVDVLTAAAKATKDYPQATLTFYHELARVTLSLTVSEKMDDASLTSVTMISDSNDLAHYLQFFTSITAAEESWSFPEIICSETLSSTESTDFDILVYPTSVEGKSATLVVDGTTYEFEFPTSLAASWEAGCQYTYPITITASSTTNDETSDGTTNLNGYEAVDLGLSVMWATCNVGAESPEDYGDYFAWGETSTKSSYTSSNSVTYGVSGISDFSGDATYDAATANWGGSWRMPTYDEMKELISDCTWTWTTQNGVKGYLVTGSNGNSIFLPAAGYRYGTSLKYAGSSGAFWSSTPYSSYTNSAYTLYFNSGYHNLSGSSRYYGHTVRPVAEF